MARRQDRVIISCAVTGGIHTPSMSPGLPVTPAEIARQSIDAIHAGAAIVHLHARDPRTGVPSPDPELFMEFLPVIKAATDGIVNITTGGGQNMTVEQRLAPPLRASPEMCSLNLGSMNFAIYPLARRETRWQQEWEVPFLEQSDDFIFRNTFRDIRYLVEKLGKGEGVRFELECYDVGHLYNLAHLIDEGVLEPPFFVQTIFGVLGGIGPDPENLMFMKRTADKLFGDAYYWSVLAAGRHQIPFTTQAAAMGGNVRVGLEDNLYLSRGVLAPDNAALVRKIRSILEELGLQPATPAETRRMLELKGTDNVGF
ncbi:MAG: 3-keto-5-aminohexanoate cleavage protein [Truepera sp.]|jgi:uncharacterized protein (DUF849 family)|nr:3-keto-5-aminohexanoate cleavage protein [Truepera sp.]